jgi:hypothetical protein
MGVNIEAQLTLTEPIWPNDTLDGDQNEPFQGIYETSATQNYAAGTLLTYPRTRRKFRYGRAGSVALAKAYMTQAEGNDANLVDELQSTSGTSVEVGDTEIVVDITTGITLVEDELTDGMLVVNKSTGIGDIYKIVASKVQSTDTLLTVQLESPIRTAWAATTEVTILKNPHWDVVVMPVTAAERPSGVPLVAVTANYWCWLQTGGPTPIYVDTGDTLVIGEPCGYPASPAVAGAVGPIGADTDLFWGIPRYVATAGEVAIVDLMLD